MADSPDILITDLRGGRNGIDPPVYLPETQCAEALNVEWGEAWLARKRNGCEAIDLTTGGATLTGPVRAIFRHVPASGADVDAELWVVDSSATPKVKRAPVSSCVFADVTLVDAIVSGGQHDMVGVSLNGKLFLAYNSGVDRLHVYDALMASPQVRRVGLAKFSTAPTVANTGSGTVPATLRYYRTRAIYVNTAGTLVNRSEPSASVSFTPSGSGSAARVTKGTVPGEHETHWELEVSLDNVTFFTILGFFNGTQIAIATSTGDDTETVVTNYALNYYLSELTGTYTLPTSYKYLSTDNNRLLGAGSWASGLKSRLFYTPVLGSADHGDDERVVITSTQKNYLDFNEKDGGDISGLSLPSRGYIYVFKYRRIFRCIPTGDVSAPYLPRMLHGSTGAVRHHSIVVAEDATGNPVVAFLSPEGPRWIGPEGVTYLGRDIEDQWRGILNGKSFVRLSATVPCHGVYYQSRNQIHWWVATAVNNDPANANNKSPDTRIVLDVRRGTRRDAYGLRGGWSIFTGPSCQAICSVMSARDWTNAGDPGRHDLKPYVGFADPTLVATTCKVYECDRLAQDDGTNYQGYLVTRGYTPGGAIDREKTIREVWVFASYSSATVQLSIIRDLALETATSLSAVSRTASESFVIRKYEDAALADVRVVQFQIGDASASSQTWSVHMIKAIVQVGGEAKGAI